jgi:hypothetical protein
VKHKGVCSRNDRSLYRLHSQRQKNGSNRSFPAADGWPSASQVTLLHALMLKHTDRTQSRKDQIYKGVSIRKMWYAFGKPSKQSFERLRSKEIESHDPLPTSKEHSNMADSCCTTIDLKRDRKSVTILKSDH